MHAQAIIFTVLARSNSYWPIGVIKTLTRSKAHIRDHFVSLAASSCTYCMYTKPEKYCFSSVALCFRQ